MPRKESIKNHVCLCCNTNRSPDKKQKFCIECYRFLHDVLQLRTSYISRKLGHNIYNSIISKCDFCGRKAIISYRDYDSKKRWYICKYHRDRWLKFGCELGELSNYLSFE